MRKVEGLIILLVVLTAGLVQAAPPAAPVHPHSAVAVVQCSTFVSVFVTWPDGRLEIIDNQHHAGYEDIEKVKALILSADSNKVLTMDCDAVGHDSV